MANYGANLATGLLASLVIVSLISLGAFAAIGGGGVRGGDLMKAVGLLGQSKSHPLVNQQFKASTAKNDHGVGPSRSNEGAPKIAKATTRGKVESLNFSAHKSKKISALRPPQRPMARRGEAGGRLGLFAFSGDLGRSTN